MLWVGSAHQETFGEYIDGYGGGDGEKKGSKVGTNISNNQQRLVVALEGSGGVALMGGDDDR